MMLKIINDLALSLDKNMDVAFLLLDHDILLTRLQEKFGVTGIVLKWLKSYLTNRIQTVVISNIKSLPSPVPCGVPQGSVLGPLLFLL